MAGLENKKEELSRSFKQIGRLLSESLGLGISEGAGQATDAMDQINEELLESQQRYFDEKSKLEQEIEAAEEAKNRQAYYNRLKKAKTEQQAETVRQNEQFRLQQKYNQEYIDALEAHLKTVEMRIEVEKDRITESFNQIAAGAVKSLEALDKARTKMAEKMIDFGGLYDSKRQIFLNSGPKGTKEVFEHTILDLSQERKDLERYAELLQIIQNQGDIPVSMFERIRDLPIEEALLYQEALLGLGEKEREAYLSDWKAIEALADQSSQASYAIDTQRMLGTIEQELEAWYGTIPDGFFNEGTLAADAFGEAFVKKMMSLQETLQDAIRSVMAGSVVQAAAAGEAAGNVVHHNNYTTTYVLSSAGETVSQQLRSARNYAAVTQMREG
ncbi:MAG: hypothetical protein IKW06_02195 [Clostridia bacterium]|nr:hypothetical protein [Clostridia bacterium]